MELTLSGIIGILGLIGTLVSAAAALTIWFKYKADEIGKETLRKQNKDLRDDVADQDRRIERLELQEEDCKRSLSEAKGQMTALTELVTQAAAVQALDQRLQAHDEEVGVLWRQVDARLGTIEKTLMKSRA